MLVAQVLDSAPNSLLLDGHTNHLDILSIRWLEMLLIGFPAPVLVIIHNHRFLDNCGHWGSGHRLPAVTGCAGNHARFLEAKAAEWEWP